MVVCIAPPRQSRQKIPPLSIADGFRDCFLLLPQVCPPGDPRKLADFHAEFFTRCHGTPQAVTTANSGV